MVGKIAHASPGREVKIAAPGKKVPGLCEFTLSIAIFSKLC